MISMKIYFYRLIQIIHGREVPSIYFAKISHKTSLKSKKFWLVGARVPKIFFVDLPLTSTSMDIFKQQQWQIQDFPEGAPTHKVVLFCKFYAENCMKMKEFGPRGRPWRPPRIHQWTGVPW